VPFRGFDARMSELALGRRLVTKVGRAGAAQTPKIHPTDTGGVRQLRQIALDVVVRSSYNNVTLPVARA
jgi:hypothetical protein